MKIYLYQKEREINNWAHFAKKKYKITTTKSNNHALNSNSLTAKIVIIK